MSSVLTQRRVRYRHIVFPDTVTGLAAAYKFQQQSYGEKGRESTGQNADSVGRRIEIGDFLSFCPI
ncbi:MAG: hypothetical protein KDD67_09905 [Ignavibacteriae bacterium]|nr:hypothetical protein [Ignavibacteriota bacterium]MCB9217730.1 hypothetical protein [Ignavibacteria bacterium]